ncbi:MAG: hypothetical protein ACFFF4_14890 [Candidatus Thorarchaeota archaeon]
MGHIIGAEKEDVENLNNAMKGILQSTVEMLSNLESPTVMNSDDWIRLMTIFPVFAMTSGSTVLKEDLTEQSSLVEIWKMAQERMKQLPVPDSFKTVSATVIEKRGVCEFYEVGDSFDIPSPFYWPTSCSGLWFAAWPYMIAAGLGFEGWEGDDPHIYRISCPSKKGIVIEMKQK